MPMGELREKSIFINLIIKIKIIIPIFHLIRSDAVILPDGLWCRELGRWNFLIQRMEGNCFATLFWWKYSPIEWLLAVYANFLVKQQNRIILKFSWDVSKLDFSAGSSRGADGEREEKQKERKRGFKYVLFILSAVQLKAKNEWKNEDISTTDVI